METALYIAQLLGAVYVLMGLAFLINRDVMKKMYMEVLKSEAWMWLLGVVTFVLGLVMVMAHNVWAGEWLVLVTIFGWAALIKGVMLVLFTDSMVSFSKGILKNDGIYSLAGVVCIVLGALLSAIGWGMM